MASVSKRSSQPTTLKESLHNGDRLLQSDFHRLYLCMPPGYKAELIGGIVFEPSPLSYSHGTCHGQLCGLFMLYSAHEQEVGFADNATVILSDDDEVQPDLLMRFENGGKSRINHKGYVEGPPELIAEVAHSSRAIDLHLKKERYTEAGVIEYVVVCLAPKQIYWFDLQSRKDIKKSRNGVYRSAIFPGLWIHGQALLDGDNALALNTLHAGLSTTVQR